MRRFIQFLLGFTVGAFLAVAATAQEYNIDIIVEFEGGGQASVPASSTQWGDVSELIHINGMPVYVTEFVLKELNVYYDDGVRIFSVEDVDSVVFDYPATDGAATNQQDLDVIIHYGGIVPMPMTLAASSTQWGDFSELVYVNDIPVYVLQTTAAYLMASNTDADVLWYSVVWAGESPAPVGANDCPQGELEPGLTGLSDHLKCSQIVRR